MRQPPARPFGLCVIASSLPGMTPHARGISGTQSAGSRDTHQDCPCMGREARALTVSDSFTAARAIFAWNAPQSARSVTVPFLPPTSSCTSDSILDPGPVVGVQLNNGEKTHVRPPSFPHATQGWRRDHCRWRRRHSFPIRRQSLQS